MLCTRWKLPGYRSPKAEPDHLHYICDSEEMRFPRNRLLPSPWRIVFVCSAHHMSKTGRRSKPRGSLRRCIRIPTAGIIHAAAIIPQNTSYVSTLMNISSSCWCWLPHHCSVCNRLNEKVCRVSCLYISATSILSIAGVTKSVKHTELIFLHIDIYCLVA